MAYSRQKNWGLQKPSTGTPLALGSPLARGLVTYYTFNENAGGRVKDYSPSLNDGVLSGTGIHWTNGRFGPATVYNGADDGLTGNIPPNTNGGAFSYGGWAKAVGSSADGVLLDVRSVSGPNGTVFFINHTTGFIEFGTQTGGTFTNIAGSTNIIDGQWHFYIATCDASGNAVLYQDGMSVATGTGFNTTFACFLIGKDNFGGFYGINVDLFGCWNRVLSPAEVLDLYQRPFSLFQSPKQHFLGVASGASFTVSPTTIPAHHSGNITLTLTGSGTAWNNGTTVFTLPSISGLVKVSQNVSSVTAATIVCTTGSGTGTGNITDSTDAATAALIVSTATLAVSPTSGTTGGSGSITLTGTNTLWTTETASTLFGESGGTGASISSISVTTDTSATATLTYGSAAATLTITDNSTTATTSFTVNAPSTNLNFDTVVVGAAHGASPTVTAQTWNGTSEANDSGATVGTPVETEQSGTYICRLTYPQSDLPTGTVPFGKWVVSGTTYVDTAPQSSTVSETASGGFYLFDSVVIGATTGQSPTVVARKWNGTSELDASATVGTPIETNQPGTYVCRITYNVTELPAGTIPIVKWTIAATVYTDTEPQPVTPSSGGGTPFPPAPVRPYLQISF